MSIAKLKSEARKVALAARGGRDPALGLQLIPHVLNSGLVPTDAMVAGFWPLYGEIDVRPLLATLRTAGCSLCLPHTTPPGQPLVFRAWADGAPLLPGRFGTVYPEGAIVTPDIILVPLLAFDATGARLGYGGGYYDRTLATLPGRTAIGCAFAAQQVDCVPTEPTDIPLHAVATERGLHIFRT